MGEQGKGAGSAAAAASEIAPDAPEAGANLRIRAAIHLIRSEFVILDRDVAAFFGKASATPINQNRARNKDRFPDSYAFQLTQAEWDDLRIATGEARGHGGARKLPWVYTEHGFTMMATRMRGRDAAKITRAVVDTFVAYRRGALPPGRAIRGENAPHYRRRVQQALYQQMESVLAQPLPTGTTVSEELASMTSLAVSRIKAMIERPKLDGEKVVAEVRKLQAETEKLMSEARRTDAETARIWAEVMQMRLATLGQLRQMAEQLERDDVTDALDEAFGVDPRAIPAPRHV